MINDKECLRIRKNGLLTPNCILYNGVIQKYCCDCYNNEKVCLFISEGKEKRCNDCIKIIDFNDYYNIIFR